MLRGFRRPIAVAMLAAYLLAAHGHLPSGVTVSRWLQRATGERFPCESCGCGCATAHECWTNCCCHSEIERLVWAIREGVLPPEGLTFTDEQWLAAANTVEPGSAHCSGCVGGIVSKLARGERTADREPPPVVTASCCASSSGCGEGDDSPVEPSGPRFSRMRCKAVEANLVVAFVAMLLADDARIPALAPAGPLSQGSLSIPDSRVLRPSPPLPRLTTSA